MTKIILTWKYGVTLALALLAGGVGYYILSQTVFHLDSTELDHFITNLGWVGPLVMIGLIAVEVIIAPLPGGWLALATGYIFGSLPGFIYAYSGNVLGAIVAFTLARYFGQPFLRKFVSDIKYEHYSQKLNRSSFGLALLYAIPLFPIDVISLLLGVSGIPRRRFLLIMTLGFIPNMAIMNFVGGSIAMPEYRYIMLALVAGVIVYFVWRTANDRISPRDPGQSPRKPR